jgi:hypothetical protein
MIYFQQAILALSLVLISYLLIYFAFRVRSRKLDSTVSVVASVALLSNFLFLLIDLFIVPGIFGGKDGWLEFWTFVFLPMSLIFGFLAARVIMKRRVGF